MQTLQTTNTTSEQPDYTVVDGGVRANKAGSEINETLISLNRQKQALDACYAGAVILQALISNPNVESFSLSISADHEYNDEGGTFLCTSARVGDVDITSLPDAAAQVNPDDIESNLQEQFEDSCSDIYSALTDEGECTELKVNVQRGKVAHLIDSGNFSGAEAFKIFFPDNTGLLNID